jgi:osmotically-inducible protein OsmY
MGLGGIGGLAGGMNARNRMGQTGGTNAQGKKAIRTIAKPDFEIKASSLPNVNVQVQQRLAKFPVPEKFRSVNASYESGEVVLRGVVATEADKRLMERLMKLEPGVDSIRNELTVQATPSESVQAVRNR